MPRRGIFEDPLFTSQKNVLQPDTRRMDDILNGVCELLAANAEAFFRIERDKNLWIVKTHATTGGAPRLRIWYTFNKTDVTLLSIEKAEDLL